MLVGRGAVGAGRRRRRRAASTSSKFKGKFEQFNLVTGLKRVFGTQALWEGAKALLKTAVVGLVLYSVIQGLMPMLMSRRRPAGLRAAGRRGRRRRRRCCSPPSSPAWRSPRVDVFVVMRRNRKKTRMTKKEVKDENKNTDGDPLIKSQRRSRQLAMSRNRMIAADRRRRRRARQPDAHRRRAQVRAGQIGAARGGQGRRHHRRPHPRARPTPTGCRWSSDIPLARALHAACELGQEIPVELYNAVARVLAFVMALKSRGAAPAGIRTPLTTHLRLTAEDRLT